MIVSLTNMYPIAETYINWNLSRRCNFDCSYCSDGLHDNISPLLSETELERAAQSLANVPGKTIFLSLTGGEPTLHKPLERMLRILSEIEGKEFKVCLTTNGSRTIEYFYRLRPFINHLTFSAHLEFFDQESILKKAFGLHNIFGSDLGINLMLLPGKLYEIKMIYERLKASSINVSVRKVRKKNSKIFFEYSEEEEKFLCQAIEGANLRKDLLISIARNSNEMEEKMVTANDINTLGLNQFQGIQCQAGVDYFTIGFQGDVFACESFMQAKKSLGSIYSKKFQWPSKGNFIRCPFESCVCTADIAIPKKESLR